MIIDTTISTTDNYINRHARDTYKRQRFSPPGVYKNRQERLEFRDLYVRDFLESHGLDSDIDLRTTVVFWKEEEVAGVFSCNNSLNDRSQNIAELLG